MIVNKILFFRKDLDGQGWNNETQTVPQNLNNFNVLIIHKVEYQNYP